MTRIDYRQTKMTRLTRAESKARLDSLPPGGWHVPVDVADDQGEIGHILVFRAFSGELCARAKGPDPRNLYARLPRSLKLKRLTLAVRD